MGNTTRLRPLPPQLLLYSSVLFLAAVLFAALARLIPLPYFFAALSYTAMTCGFALRKVNRVWHGRLMLMAITIDLTLVFILELQKNVVQTAVNETLTFVQHIHIAASLGATVFYLPLLYLGFRLWRAPQAGDGRSWHRRLGIMAFLLRTIGFITMFSMLSRLP